MSGRILIADGVATNRIVLRVRLASAFYTVEQAVDGRSAFDAMRRNRPDLVLCSSDLPDMTGRQFCNRLRATAAGADLPVVLLLEADDAAARRDALSAGADDVICRPVDELVLLARIRALLRARDAEAELRLRDDTRRALGLAEDPAPFAAPASVTLVPVGPGLDIDALLDRLGRVTPHRIAHRDPEQVLRDGGPVPDVFVLAEAPGPGGAALPLLSQLRSDTRTRHAAIVYVAQPGQREHAAAALDIGASDLMSNGLDAQELALRLAKQVARKRTADRLRADMQDGLRAAVIDPLTGIYNRRYALPHLGRLAEQAKQKGRSYALLSADLDHFKQINDGFGHPAGDAVLGDVARRLRDNLRAADMVARIGGEEFLVAMPDTSQAAAMRTAQRLRRLVADNPVELADGRVIPVTISIGVAIGAPDAATSPTALLDASDRALYAAKRQGRDTVVLADNLAALPRRRKDRAESDGARTKPARALRGTG
ncbi:diguanylate cyclase [Thalassococcus sp. CAU 1522]|uniref:diguanylate cyclase n=1 Tax=Thalassococcus arenae TaxID=2851652 RepID=A0ABS6N397_9RHOB|nr:diguanylate cyclase [Thalassococcus arenae]MBV2358484.1 diguanylate cyclase [Thalassococcus arenae]